MEALTRLIGESGFAGLIWQNVVMFAINCLGVYRYLIAGKDDDKQPQAQVQPEAA